MTQRLRDTRTGVAVRVDDATAARLGAAYEPVEGRGGGTSKDEKPAPRRRPAKPKK